ncbi:bacteriocin fulvocin C-related protein [Nonomuraea sp. NBC_00507]|uniref:bacteriocin fulvocin C-related protein n=1 Tax=Nonomuraea sp. NBC_00507 TaxID=2976002 RepID=UPI002E1962B5
MRSHSRWILGFDASCGRCNEIAKAAKAAAGEKLEVLPLAHPDVLRWREEALGAEAPWAPTLLRVDENRVRAWTGPAMGMRLLGRLGPKASIKLFGALGELSRANQTATSGQDPIGRRRFFRFGAGFGIAVGIVLTGEAPALADEPGKARAWVAANKDRLPKTYSAFSEHTMPYRRAIYQQLDPSARSKLWLEHFATYRQNHPNLSPRQESILASLEEQARNVSKFHPHNVTDAERSEDERLKLLVADAFGHDETIALIATLGPVEPVNADTAKPDNNAALAVDCECSTQSDWCTGLYICSQLPSCTVSYDGCGTWYQYACNGMCTVGCGC